MDLKAFTGELLEKAKAAKTAEELLALAKENGVADFTAQDAAAYFAQLNKYDEVPMFELKEDELAKTTGGIIAIGDKPANPCPYCGSMLGCPPCCPGRRGTTYL